MTHVHHVPYMNNGKKQTYVNRWVFFFNKIFHHMQCVNYMYAIQYIFIVYLYLQYRILIKMRHVKILKSNAIKKATMHYVVSRFIA